MRPPLLLLLPAAALLVALVPPVGAHGTFEASELEVHVLNDEGSDAIEPYGGYDINELFVGFAHDPAIGRGAAGDGFYFRLEAYGLMDKGAHVPGQPWSLQVTAGTPNGPLTRTISTTDGTTFTSDFDALLAEVEPAERSTHFQRAFVSFAKAGLAPGQPLGPFKVESRAGTDLRDVAPGGIPVPGTNGAATYPDPAAIPGKGLLVETVPLQGPERYVQVSLQGRPDHAFNVTVRSALHKGGQHVFVQADGADGWTYTLDGTTTKALEANGTLTFALHAVPANATGPLRLDILTDIGGRTELVLGPDEVLRGPNGLSASLPAPPPKPSPGAGALAACGVLASAWVARSRRSLP
ncbi:MAG TPA: hypothetical protein VM286_10240 [Candidatus Thermoplasmatota archaeon]|nr:hypothetical protein [Candidatus Thermoplasmatota archaeon]